MTLESYTYFSDTASLSEVLVPAVGALVWAVWGLSFWWYGRKGETPFRDDAPRWQIFCAWGSMIFVGLLSIFFAAWAFMPGELW